MKGEAKNMIPIFTKPNRSSTQLAGLLLLFGACTDSPAPTPPSTPTGTTTETSGTLGSDNTPEFTADNTPATVTATGANIGPEAIRKAVATCNAAGNFFDRYANDGEGDCLLEKLAKTVCSVEHIKTLLKGNEKTSFADAMVDAYDGYEIDQCLDCPEDNSSDLCKASNGERQIGTKVYFAKEDGDQLLGKARLITVRPGQD